MARNLNKPLTVDEIASACNLNPSRLMHLFRAQENCTVMQYLYQERIRAAENMLKYSDVTATQIADRFYFSSPSHFGRYFKKVTGMSPIEYREKFHVTEFTT